MIDLSDRELSRVRLRFIDLIKSFFTEQPDAEKMSRWRGIFSALSHEQISPSFDSGVRQLSEILSKKNLAELQEEFYQLFVNPFEGHLVETTASYYLSGRSYGETLVDVRNFMNDAGLHKDKEVTEPEDALVVLLDSFASLVELEKETNQEDRARTLQVRMLRDFLEPLAEHFEQALRSHDRAQFYPLCAKLLCGYLELEKGLVGAV
jgi:TorA maturation chaperone TorD